MDDGSGDHEYDKGAVNEEKDDYCICSIYGKEEDMQEEGAPVRPLKSTSTPSRRELLEHSLTHYPFGSWCPHCVKGKSKANRHSSTGGVEESEVPVVYLIMHSCLTEQENLLMMRTPQIKEDLGLTWES